MAANEGNTKEMSMTAKDRLARAGERELFERVHEQAERVDAQMIAIRLALENVSDPLYAAALARTGCDISANLRLLSALQLMLKPEEVAA